MSKKKLTKEEKAKKKRSYDKKYYAEHPEYRESRRKYLKKYRAENLQSLRKKEKERAMKRKEEKKAYDKIYRLRPQKRFTDIRGNARIRGFSFTLTFDELMLFWQEPCSYCGSEIKTVNLDRVDNDKGYDMDNVVSCCYICNMMKRTLPKDIFLEHCEKVVNFNKEQEV